MRIAVEAFKDQCPCLVFMFLAVNFTLTIEICYKRNESRHKNRNISISNMRAV